MRFRMRASLRGTESALVKCPDRRVGCPGIRLAEPEVIRT